VEGLGADNVVLFLLENPELLPRVPAKPTPNSRLSPELTTTDGRGGCNRGTAVEEPRNSGSGRPVGRCERKRGAIAQVEEEEVVELTAARAPCEPASRSRSAATTSCSGCSRGEEEGGLAVAGRREGDQARVEGLGLVRCNGCAMQAFAGQVQTGPFLLGSDRTFCVARPEL
jgi:hypothetical protein